MSSDRQLDLINNPSRVFSTLPHQAMKWRVACGELIDNSLDWSATRIVIEVDRKAGAITFTDNGKGVDDKRLVAMFSYGQHEAGPQTRIGRHGIGFKHAAGWMGSPVTVRTCFRGQYTEARRDWYKDSGMRLSAKEWAPITDDVIAEYGLDRRGGVSIHIAFARKPRRTFPRGKDLDQLIADLSVQYAPFVRSGGQIVIVDGSSTITVPAYDLPELERSVDRTLALKDDPACRFTVRAGVVRAGVDNPRPGIAVTYGMRTLYLPSGNGCGRYAIDRVAGVVELHDGGWLLSQHKDAISDQEQVDALFAAVLYEIEPILKAAGSQVRILHMQELNDWLSESLTRDVQAYFSGAKGAGDKKKHGEGGGGSRNRSQRNSTLGGGVGPRPGGRGDKRDAPRSIAGVGYLLCALEDGKLYTYEMRAGGWVALQFNTEHPYVQKHLTGGTDTAKDKLRLLAHSVLGYELAFDPSAQRIFSFAADVDASEMLNNYLWYALPRDEDPAAGEEAA